jgi:serine/threonine protein kinase
LANGVEVAIKQLLVKTQKTIDEFLNEVVIISGVKHRNLVKLKGCCLRDNKRLLVYEYLENGDLANLLFGEFFNFDKYFHTSIIFSFFLHFFCLTIFTNGSRTLRFYHTHFRIQSIEEM